MAKLPAKQRLFAETYVAMNNNGTAAYKHVYKVKKDKTAQVSASKLLSKPMVSEYVKFLQDKATDDTIMSRKETLQRLTILGRASVKDVVTFNSSTVKLRDSSTMTDDELYTVLSVSSAKGKTDKLDIKQVDKIKALEALAKHHGVLDGKGSEKGQGTGSENDSGTRESVADRVLASIKELKK